METEGRAREKWREREGFEMLNKKRKMTALAQKLEKKKKQPLIRNRNVNPGLNFGEIV